MRRWRVCRPKGGLFSAPVLRGSVGTIAALVATDGGGWLTTAQVATPASARNGCIGLG